MNRKTVRLSDILRSKTIQFSLCHYSIYRRAGEHFKPESLAPTERHPGTVHVRGYFIVQETGALHLKNMAMNAVWYEKVLIEELLPSI